MKSLGLILSNPRYFAPVFVFASLNIWFGTWAIYIPFVKERLVITNVDLGIALSFLACGVFVVFPIVSKIISSIGVGKTTWLGVIFCTIASVLPLIAPNYPLLCGALFVFGVSNGITDIAINTLVTELEKEDKVQFMSSAHGFFSFGGVIAGLGSFLIPLLNNPVLHMVLVATPVFLINFSLKKKYIQQRTMLVTKERISLKLFKLLFLLGVIGFVSFASEGAIVDWSSLYLKEVTSVPEQLTGAGFLAFSVAMMIGRFLGDGISEKGGAITTVILGVMVAISGYLCILFGSAYRAIFGFALTGLGFSVVVPELFRIGGKIQGVNATQGITFIAGLGYLGFLSGPVILGFLAETFNLKASFYALLGCAAGIVVIAAIFKKYSS